jgi:hypothetical protein
MGLTEDLWEIEQIKQLKARYCRFLDTKDWAAFAQLFTADCVHYLPGAEVSGSITNDDYLGGLKVQLADAVTVHHVLAPEITLLNPTEAEGVWAMSGSLRVGSPDGPRGHQAYGHYFESYRKGRDNRWRISAKRNVRLWLDEA